MSDADLLGECHDEFERRAEERRARRQSRPSRRGPGRRRRRNVANERAGWLDRRLLTVLAAALAVATVVGLAVLWPGGTIPRLRNATPAGHGAHVLSVRDARCDGPSGGHCVWATVSVSHEHARVDLGPATTAPGVSVAEAIRVGRATFPSQNGATRATWQFVDIDRHGSLL